MHGAFGNDLMNGEQDPDHIFGGAGGDAMWGGTSESASQGADILFGGFGGSNPDTGGADVLDYTPRTGDPAKWREMVIHNAAGRHGSQGKDFLYGGFNRDVLEGSFHFQPSEVPGTPSPKISDGDWLVDWVGVTNLYCNSDLSGTTRVDDFDSSIAWKLMDLAYAAGAGLEANHVSQEGESAYEELALVQKHHLGANTLSSYGTIEKFKTTDCR
jgi:hypothetical protein